jgi:Asp-tRNA(Asn)/Glu-tRNA(Gln) amidotransferase A subunit family amidase
VTTTNEPAGAPAAIATDALPHVLDATAVAAAVRGGRLTVRDVAEAVLARHAARDADVRAWAHLDPAQVLAAADALDAQPVKGPLHGVPVGVKDVIATKDMPTEHATARYAGSVPGVDAACVDTLRAAGALIVGKTTTTQFAATSVGGPTRNPHDPGRTPGGSSSGSGAAVADLQCALALGTQTGGSTIRPGSFNGVYAWKPTWNSISREGLKMYSVTCDTLGLYARSARDLALLADVFQIEPAPVPTSLAGARVAVCRTPEWRAATSATRDAMATAADALRGAGAEVVDLALPGWFDGLYPAHRAILRREGRSAFLNEYVTTQDLPPFFRDVVEGRPGVDMNGRPAPELTADDYRAAYALADRARAAFDEVAADFDVVLTPSATGEAPEGLQNTGSSVFNSMWTLLQVPVVNVPGLTGPADMPVGVSLVSRRYEDRRAIGYAGLLGELLAGA